MNEVSNFPSLIVGFSIVIKDFVILFQKDVYIVKDYYSKLYIVKDVYIVKDY